MTQKIDWKKPFAIVLFVMLLGAYYERMNVETQAMVLPMVIILVSALGYSRFRQLEYEISAFRVNAREAAVQSLSVIDGEGRQRAAISTGQDGVLMEFFDDDHISRVRLDVTKGDPVLKLNGDQGSVWITFDPNGKPNLTVKDAGDQTLWSAP